MINIWNASCIIVYLSWVEMEIEELFIWKIGIIVGS